MDFDQILAALEQATDADLQAASTELARLRADAEAAPVTEESVSNLERYAEVSRQLAAESTRRQTLASRRAAALSDIPTPPEGGTEDAPQGGQEDAPEGGQPSGDNPPADAPEGEPGGGDGTEPGTEPGAVTASARRPLGTVGNRAAPAQRPVVPVVSSNTVVQGNIQGHSAGTQLSEDGLVQAMLDTWSSISNVRGTGRHPVSRTVFSYPEDRQLGTDARVNRERLDAARRGITQESLVAAGGLCAPLETRYDINVLGVTARPVRDALVRFQVDRGGLQWRPPMNALAMTDGLGVWTVDDDELVGVVETPDDLPDPQKTCAIVDCPDLQNAVVYAIYLCLQFPNFTARFDPEWVAASTRAALIAHARFAENRLLSIMLAGSKLLTSDKKVSAVRDMLTTLDQTIAYYRNRHRLDNMVPLRIILPRWVQDLFRADLTRGFAGDLDALAVADSQILSWFRARGVTPTFHLDGNPAADVVGAVTVPAQSYADAAAGSAVPGFPDAVDAILYAEGDWTYMDGGILDLGLVRDSSLNKINRYQTFVENWEGAFFDGIESLRLVMTLQPTGAVVGTLDPATTNFAD